MKPVVSLDQFGLSIVMILRRVKPPSGWGHLVEELLEIPYPLPRFVDQVDDLPWIPILPSRVDRPLRRIGPVGTAPFQVNPLSFVSGLLAYVLH